MVNKPGFYTGTLVYTICMLAVVACLCAASFQSADVRKYIGFFTLVVSIGTIAIVTHLFLRIMAAEKAVYGETDPNLVHSVGLCPDAYVLDEKSGVCKPDNETVLTLGTETISDYDDQTESTYTFNATADLPKIDENAKLDVKGIETICNNDERMRLPYSEFKPLCGIA